MTITEILKTTPEELQAKSVEELQAMHAQAEKSNQKKLKLKADVIRGVLNAKSKEEPKAAPAPEAKKEPEKVLVENSVKKPAARKAPAKKAPAKKPEVKAVEEKKAPAKKAPAAKKAAPVKEEPEAKQELFPDVIKTDKSSYEAVKLKTVEEIQQALVDEPFHYYLFVDEEVEQPVQFLILFASKDVIVLLDRNDMINTTVTIKTKQLKPDVIDWGKEHGKFPYRMYRKNV